VLKSNPPLSFFVIELRELTRIFYCSAALRVGGSPSRGLGGMREGICKYINHQDAIPFFVTLIFIIELRELNGFFIAPPYCAQAVPPQGGQGACVEEINQFRERVATQNGQGHTGGNL
jgi:hypothetical protein